MSRQTLGTLLTIGVLLLVGVWTIVDAVATQRYVGVGLILLAVVLGLIEWRR